MDENQNPVYKNKEYGKSRELLYSYNNNGQYEQTVGFHGEPDRVILQQAWDHFNERTDEARQRVRDGKASPIVYYMEKNLLDPMNLGMIAGISLWRVKRHFKPAVFKKLSDETLQKYAKAFDITLEQLRNIE